LDELKNEIAAQKAKIEKDNKNKAELKKAENFFKEKTYKFKKFTNETISFDKNSKIEGNNLILELDQW